MDKSHYHFIGIGGIGMSGLAQILLQQGHRVSGSDLGANCNIENLNAQGVLIHFGHAGLGITKDSIVIYTTGLSDNNGDVLRAQELGCTLWHRSELLNHLMQGFEILAVTGTHGKTSTSSMLATVLQAAKVSSSFAIGGIVANFNANAAIGKGRYFVVEADESDGSYLRYHPHGAIITNIDNDHLNHFGNMESLISSFVTFARQVYDPKLLLWCGDDSHLCAMQLPGPSYGFAKNCDWHISDYHAFKDHSLFNITYQGVVFKDIQLSSLGRHQASNATAVFAMAFLLGIETTVIKDGLQRFLGVSRRLEKLQERPLIFDDYAHHPTEIGATLLALRQAYSDRKLVVVFQPHRYTRIQHCLLEFSDALKLADTLYLTDLYSAGEKPIDGVSTERILQVLKNDGIEPIYVARKNLVPTLARNLRPDDLCITLGAGDITIAARQLASAFQEMVWT